MPWWGRNSVQGREAQCWLVGRLQGCLALRSAAGAMPAWVGAAQGKRGGCRSVLGVLCVARR